MIALKNKLRERAAELAQHHVVVLRAALGGFLLLVELSLNLLKFGPLAVIECLCRAAERQQAAKHRFLADAEA